MDSRLNQISHTYTCIRSNQCVNTHMPHTQHTNTYTHDIRCSTHAQHQPPSYQSAKQSNSKRINTSETVEYALSKGTATEIGASNPVNNYCRINCNNNHSVSFEQSADSNTKNMSADQNRRDRLGFWGNDSEVAGAVSGLDRLRLSRYNKVRKSFPYTIQKKKYKTI